MALRTLVVDDEKPARDRLVHLLRDDDRVEVVGSVATGMEAVDFVERHRPDLILLDIQMPGMDGFDVVRMCHDLPIVVFTTAYDEYAIKAFEVHALDYLLKPIPRQRLHTAIDRALAEHAKLHEADGAAAWQQRLQEVADAVAPRSRPLTRIPVRLGERIQLVDTDDVLWFYVQDKLVSLVTADARLDTHYTTIHELEQKLDPEVFFRVHRSVVVNLNHIREIRPWFHGTLKVVVDDGAGTELDVSREHARRLRRRIGW